MIDFKELSKDGSAFEQLVREICLVAGLHPQWSGKGADQGRDLIITETRQGPIAKFERRWLIQCKHNAHAGTSVGRDHVGSVVDDCQQVGADGYLLACTTQPSSSLVTKLNEISGTHPHLVTKVWDGVDIEKMLTEPRFFSLGHLFFPKSFAHTPWKLFNRGAPNRWTGNYKDYFMYLCSRISGSHPQLTACEDIIKKIEQVGPLGVDECIRPRSIYFDDKHEHFYVSVDYLVPNDRQPRLKPSNFEAVLHDGQGLYYDDKVMWYITMWDIQVKFVSLYSDHFDRDHYKFYEEWAGNYMSGLPRSRTIGELAEYGDFWPNEPKRPIANVVRKHPPPATE